MLDSLVPYTDVEHGQVICNLECIILNINKARR